MKRPKPDRSLEAVKREFWRARLADIAAWRMAVRNLWRIDIVWKALNFRWKNARRRKVLATMIDKKMAFAWRDTRPKKQLRRLGLLPPIPSTKSTMSTQSTP